MATNEEQIDKTLSETVKNQPDKPSNDAWVYRYGCSIGLEEIVLKTLILLCQQPFKEQIMAAMMEAKGKEFAPTEIPRLVEPYWARFMSAMKLPTARRVDIPEPKDSNSGAWDVTMARLEQLGIDEHCLEQAIEDEMPKPEHRDLVHLLLNIWISPGMWLSDQVVHTTYEAIVRRYWEISPAHGADGLDHIPEAEGYKLDEGMTIDYARAVLYDDESFLKQFFGIQGERLPKLLTRALKAIDRQADSDEGLDE